MPYAPEGATGVKKISIMSIKRYISVMETECVFYGVGIKFL
jgi:hypothetical protein